MTQYDNTNTGMLSRNDRKEKDTHPDFKGFCDIEGTEYWISGWIREAGPQAKTPGRKFFSLRFEPKNPPAQVGAPATGGQASAAGSDYGDDIPF
jgi:hypothetical protein